MAQASWPRDERGVDNLIQYFRSSIPRCPPGLRTRSDRRPSELSAVFRGKKDLGHRIGAQPQLFRYFGWPYSTLAVEQRQPFLGCGPRVTAVLVSGPAGSGRLPARLRLASRLGSARRLRPAIRGLGSVFVDGGAGARRGRRTTVGSSSLIMVSAAGHVLASAFIEYFVLIRCLVDAHGHHRQTSEVLLLTSGRGAVVVFLRSLGR